MAGELVDRVYEAAFVPEGWPGVLDALAARSGSAGGGLFVAAAGLPPRWVASDCVAARLAAFTNTGAWRTNRRRSRWTSSFGGFSRDVDIFTPAELEHPDFQTHGLGFQLGTVIPMPSGEQVIVSLERHRAEGPHGSGASQALDRFRPHLARAGLLAARLGLDRARTAVETLEAVGLPAAVLNAGGRVLTVNALIEARVSGLILPAAHGGIAIADAAANRLTQAALAEAGSGRVPSLQSIPVAAAGERGAAVLHLVPLRGAAHDIFSGAATLLVVTGVGPSECVADATVLLGLFDLTPAEARLAAALCEGKSLKEGAAAGGIRFSTARSSLERIFRKTGTHQQSQLVALLKSVRSLASGA